MSPVRIFPKSLQSNFVRCVPFRNIFASHPIFRRTVSSAFHLQEQKPIICRSDVRGSTLRHVEKIEMREVRGLTRDARGCILVGINPPRCRERQRGPQPSGAPYRFPVNSCIGKMFRRDGRMRGRGLRRRRAFRCAVLGAIFRCAFLGAFLGAILRERLRMLLGDKQQIRGQSRVRNGS